MTPAEYVIHIFGGVRPLARALDCDATSVLRWKKQRGGGAVGIIPSNVMPRILRLAEQHGIDCTAEDLIFGR